MSKALNIIVGSAMAQCVNRGCEALAYSLVYLISHALARRGIACNITLTNSGHPDNGEYELNVNGERLKYASNCNIVCQVNGLRRLLFVLKLLVKPGNLLASRRKAIRYADYIFDIGGGDSFSDIYGCARFNEVNSIYKLARVYKKPYCILPQTIGPFENTAIREEAIKTIAAAGLVMARDRQSYEYVRELVPQQTSVAEYIDVAFFLPYTKRSFRSDFINVGLNVSALLWNGGYTKDNQFGLGVNYQEVTYMIIDYLLSLQNVQVHLVPHVNGSFRDVENDYEVCYDIYREYSNPRLVLSDFFLSPIDAKDYISGLDFFIGARMHSTIAAFSSLVPVVPMAYSRKFNGLFKDTLHYDHIADLKVDTKEQILETIMQSFERRGDLKEEATLQMRTTVANAGKRIEDDICRFMNV